MSKKLIAVASAAALALTALVGVAPASANYTFGVTANGEISTAQGLNASSALAINVPSQDVLRVDEATPATDTAANQSATASAIRLNIQASTTSAAVRVVTTGGVKVISETQYSTTADRKTATGVQDLSVTSSSSDGKVNVVIYSTSTTAGTVTITQGGNSAVLHVKGVTRSTYAYKYTFTTTATANVSDTLDLSGSITDAFGNKIEGIAAQPFTLTLFGSASAAATGEDAWTESTTAAGTYTFGVTTSATAGSGIVGLALTSPAVKITALGTPTANAFFSFSTASLADQVTALTASVAALKVDYNALAAKYNKLVKKSKRVALK